MQPRRFGVLVLTALVVTNLPSCSVAESLRAKEIRRLRHRDIHHVNKLNEKTTLHKSLTRTSKNMELKDEDVAFWTQMMRRTQVGSMPPSPPSPPSPFSTPFPSDGGIPVSTPLPTDGSAGTPFPTDGGAGTPLPTDGGASTPFPTGGGAGTPFPTDGGGMDTPRPTGANLTQPPAPTPVLSAMPTFIDTLPPADDDETPTYMPTEEFVAGEVPTYQPTSGSGDGAGFNCPSPELVGCTAPDPSNPTDECSPVGEPCVTDNGGEFCCLDACPRNYCTAKPAMISLETAAFTVPLPEVVKTTRDEEEFTTSSRNAATEEAAVITGSNDVGLDFTP